MRMGMRSTGMVTNPPVMARLVRTTRSGTGAAIVGPDKPSHDGRRLSA